MRLSSESRKYSLMKTLSIYDVTLDTYPQLLIIRKNFEHYKLMTYYIVREFVLPCIACDERMHFQVVIKEVNAIYQGKNNEYNAKSRIQ